MDGSTPLMYTQRVQPVYLQEEMDHPGTYSGYFIYNSFGDQYSGNYTVTYDSMINGKQVTAASQFQTTIYGCQKCHNRKLDNLETSFIHGELDGEQYEYCAYKCHGGSKGFYPLLEPPLYGPPVNANPMHVHDMEYGHSGGFLEGSNYSQPPYNIYSHRTVALCEECHTSFIHDSIGTDIANIANYTLYGNNISFSSGKHSDITCVQCHFGPGPWSGEMTIFQGTLGSYNPTFTSSLSVSDMYEINIDGTNEEGTQALEIRVIGDDFISPTSGYVSLYLIGPVDNSSTGLQTPCGPSENIPCEKTQYLSEPLVMNITNPNNGKWLAKLTRLQEGTINYTIISNYPMGIKPNIIIPECNDCHNQDSIPEEKRYSKYTIPDWNPGFAHADTNGDGTLDIQCRMCHNSMHNITVKTCQYCHAMAPANHPISEPYFSQYNQTQCLSCHGDTHNVTRGGGPDCISCHDNGGISTKQVNVNILNNSVHRNLNFDVIVPPGLRTDNRVCWGCHQSDGTQPRDHPDRTTNPYGCIDCHGRDIDTQPPHIRSGYTIYTNPARKIGQEIVDGYAIGPASTGQNMTHMKDTTVSDNSLFKVNQEEYMFSRHSNPFAPGRYPGTFDGGNRDPNIVCINCHAQKIRDFGHNKENTLINGTGLFCYVGCHNLWINYPVYPLPTPHEISVTKCTDCHSLLVGWESPAHNVPDEVEVPPGYYFNIVFIGSKIGTSAHARLVNDTATGLPFNNKGCLVCHTDAGFTLRSNGTNLDIILNEDSKSHLWKSESFCTDCHSLPGEPPLSGPDLPPHNFHAIGKGNNSACLDCHGGTDKRDHNIMRIGGTNCTSCHSPGDANVSLFGRHADINISDGPGNVTNNDCWTCHFQKDMNRSNVYLCGACHSNDSGIVRVVDPSLIKSDFMHGMTTCKACHAPSGYHQKGNVGPLGLIERIQKKIS